MGLETVEIAMRVEDEFQIKIQDDEYCKCRSVGDLVTLIQEKLDVPQRMSCKSPFVFCRLRQALMELFDIPRSSIGLDAGLETLIPVRGRRQHWRTLQQRLGWKTPSLVLFGNVPVESLSNHGDFCFTLALVLVIVALFTPGLWLLVTLLAGLAIFLKCTVFLTPFARTIPACCTTIRETVRTIQVWNYIQRPGDPNPDVSEEISLRIRKIVSDCLGIPIQEIGLGARFIEDLHCG